MNWTAVDLHSKLELEPNRGASESQISDFEGASGLTLVDDLRSLYFQCNGAEHPRLDFSLSSLQDLQEYSGFPEDSPWQVFGLAPIVDLHNSDPYCICCRGPLSGMVVLFRHDGDRDIRFRSLDELFATIAKALREPRPDLEDLESPFDHTLRTGRDIEVGRELLSNADSFPDESRSYACRFGMTLLGEDQVEEIIAWIGDKCEYVRADAAARLRQIGSARALSAITAFENDFSRFVIRCSEVLTAAGFGCSLHKKHSLRVDRVPERFSSEEGLPAEFFEKLMKLSPLWLNTTQLFGLRTNSDFDAWLVGRVTELARLRMQG